MKVMRRLLLSSVVVVLVLAVTAPTVFAGSQRPGSKAEAQIAQGASPALACLATTWFTAHFIYTGINMNPEYLTYKGTACLNGSQSWGTSITWVQRLGYVNTFGFYYGYRDPTFFMANTSVTEKEYPSGYYKTFMPHAWVKLYQVGTTWHVACYDPGSADRFNQCWFTFEH